MTTAPTVPPLTPEPKTYSIHEVAEAAGITVGALRMWECRYGWPLPTRNRQNGYRRYRQWDIENATRLVKLTHEGWQIGQLIKDGLPCWPKPGEKPMRVAAPTLRVKLTGPTHDMVVALAKRLGLTPDNVIERCVRAYYDAPAAK